MNPLLARAEPGLIILTKTWYVCFQATLRYGEEVTLDKPLVSVNKLYQLEIYSSEMNVVECSVWTSDRYVANVLSLSCSGVHTWYHYRMRHDDFFVRGFLCIPLVHPFLLIQDAAEESKVKKWRILLWRRTLLTMGKFASISQCSIKSRKILLYNIRDYQVSHYKMLAGNILSN